jgi:ribonuclease HI
MNKLIKTNEESNNETHREVLKLKVEKEKVKIKKKQYYYAVVEGHNPGIYYCWDECKKEINGYSSPIYRKFTTKKDAQSFIDGKFTIQDLKLDDDEKAMLSVETSEIIDNDKDKNIFELTKFNNFQGDYYIFTDGSYHKEKDKNTFISKYSIYFGKYSTNISHIEKDSTNNKCELLAIYYTLKVLDNYKKSIKEFQKNHINSKIYIVTDSTYCINSLTIWIKSWQKNSWKTKEDEPVKNKETFININLLMSKLKLHKIRYEFKHVNSHQPPPLSDKKELFLWKGNVIADYLAKEYN